MQFGTNAKGNEVATKQRKKIKIKKIQRVTFYKRKNLLVKL